MNYAVTNMSSKVERIVKRAEALERLARAIERVNELRAVPMERRGATCRDAILPMSIREYTSTPLTVMSVAAGLGVQLTGRQLVKAAHRASTAYERRYGKSPKLRGVLMYPLEFREEMERILAGMSK